MGVVLLSFSEGEVVFVAANRVAHTGWQRGLSRTAFAHGPVGLDFELI